MGCYPLGEMVSKALKKCKGRKRHGTGTATLVYSPPPTYSYARSMAKHVTFNTDSPTVIVPPEPSHAQMVPPISMHHPEAGISPSSQAEMVQPKEQCRVHFAPEPNQPDEIPNLPRPKPPHVKFAGEPEHHNAFPFPYPTRSEPAHSRPDVGMTTGPNRNEPAPTYTGPGYRYMTSPLPRWEEGTGDRRREYFSGEYHYYPTPVREGIYRIATDANRLTTIFSEENPNACSIV
ncbi:hypothetical protein Cni_G02057 [Canna indica]|uniref:Uncharacterized protein n=1 Tax=Canna indica TaxID=4628 RepID=A0AAQ3PZ82_9LILI|nr:hypothetical protein Cni_G02057 [Canna indica]